MDTVFRKSNVVSEAIPESKSSVVNNKTTQSIDTGVEVPYTEYQSINGKPYLAEYFDLGENWDVYTDEINNIDSYLQDKIKSGELSNSVKAIKKEISNLEKMNNLNFEERTVIKTGVLSSYIKFLNDTKNIKKNYSKFYYR